MKLDANALRYLDREDFRVLTAVEMGMRNHELVPVELVTQIASLRLGGAKKILSTLLRHKLLHHDRQHFDGYRLTSLGYDFLALRTLVARGLVMGVGRQIGVGKESDIFVVLNEDHEEFCLKLHRLGRTSFRAIKNKRDYHQHRGSPSWLYLSRLAANKELTFMRILHEHDFPVPTPIDGNRHVILMSLADGFPLNQVRNMEDPAPVYTEMMDLIERFAKHGLIHGDFNEFNVLINEKGKLTVIDFPQMVSINHPNARMYFERDVNCVRRFFRKKFNFVADMRPDFDEVLANRVADLDVKVAASGFTRKMAKDFDRFVESMASKEDQSESDESDDESDGDDGEESSADEGDDDEAGSEADVAKVDESTPKEATKEATATQAPLAAAAPEPPLTEQQVAGEIATGNTNAEKESSNDIAVNAKEQEREEDDAEEEPKEENQQQQEVSDDDDIDAATLGDGPRAHLDFDQTSKASERPRVDDIRRRVRRDLRKKHKHGQGKGKSSRNTIKSREKRLVYQDMKNAL
ncbi:Serine/threonine-protein kinase rio2 [Hondaea fermentalgiana]|uniref:Serine/threonine-protein kinase RIO2 n=1 Tax=Hondaea fermentalgiana TaxID=2315210 RepID=A0A2R5G1F9_9STRA|nr:Serine/threonine-protein kinase rio2 [Hondaea fermentalgiana]|eukprot:GBG24857.1 Serine/threonine-protein kinase rio2 [Hondaea fermentalgiana]